jgi:hypothetical protein
MTIELSPEQAALLHALVENRLSSLSSEIRHTDSPHFREELRGERQLLRQLLDLLAPRAA